MHTNIAWIAGVKMRNYSVWRDYDLIKHDK